MATSVLVPVRYGPTFAQPGIMAVAGPMAGTPVRGAMYLPPPRGVTRCLPCRIVPTGYRSTFPRTRHTLNGALGGGIPVAGGHVIVIPAHDDPRTC